MRDMTERRIEDPKIFIRPAMELAPYLAGKLLCRDMDESGRKQNLLPSIRAIQSQRLAFPDERDAVMIH